ncbi:hypothetical protein D1007_59115 [Hordeum vulgare]|nr:hypothetical protein D1007_59115 [Hordeum vulgare]
MPAAAKAGAKVFTRNLTETIRKVKGFHTTTPQRRETTSKDVVVAGINRGHARLSPRAHQTHCHRSPPTSLARIRDAPESLPPPTISHTRPAKITPHLTPSQPTRSSDHLQRRRAAILHISQSGKAAPPPSPGAAKHRLPKTSRLAEPRSGPTGPRCVAASTFRTPSASYCCPSARSRRSHSANLRRPTTRAAAAHRPATRAHWLRHNASSSLRPCRIRARAGLAVFASAAHLRCHPSRRRPDASCRAARLHRAGRPAPPGRLVRRDEPRRRQRTHRLCPAGSPDGGEGGERRGVGWWRRGLRPDRSRERHGNYGSPPLLSSFRD